MQYEDENDKKVSRKYVLDNMDRETWLSGIGRAAFHWSATRETKDGKTIFLMQENCLNRGKNHVEV